MILSRTTPKWPGTRPGFSTAIRPTRDPGPVITVVKLTWGQLDGLVEDIEEDLDRLDWSGWRAWTAAWWWPVV